MKYLETILISFTREVINSISKNLGMFFSALTTTSLSFLLLYSLLILYFNIENIQKKIINQLTIHVYLKKEIKGEQIKEIIYQIEKIDDIINIQYISSNEALRRIEKELNIDISKDLIINPLPNIIYVKVGDPRKIEKVAEIIKNIKGVQEVDYWQEYVKKISIIIDILNKVFLFIIAILSFGILTIISNTVKMTILARRNEIRIMHLVGAPNWFIKYPLITEGIIILIISNFLAFYFIKIFYNLLSNWIFTNLSFISLVSTDFINIIRNYILLTSFILIILITSNTIERYLKKLIQGE
ncbi:MAG: cell division protein FtsX [bacterium]|jgi:cell division transport system permease protein